jgi:hypothetical protein
MHQHPRTMDAPGRPNSSTRSFQVSLVSGRTSSFTPSYCTGRSAGVSGDGVHGARGEQQETGEVDPAPQAIRDAGPGQRGYLHRQQDVEGDDPPGHRGRIPGPGERNEHIHQAEVHVGVEQVAATWIPVKIRARPPRNRWRSKIHRRRPQGDLRSPSRRSGPGPERARR